MNYGIAFTPLVPSLVLWLAVAAVAVIAACCCWAGPAAPLCG